ncbi:MAG: hypothetical protein H7249_06275 [Chitinophagaceae bacterium]|nr:hypothetical protein [Oligoflexus sp.]
MKARRRALLLILPVFALLSASCNQRPKWTGFGRSSGAAVPETSSNSIPVASETGDVGSSEPGLDLVWKRYRAFEDGLVTGLALNKATFCQELGKQSCIDKVHLTFLGGNDPFEAGLYERAQTPTSITAVAVDRVVLYACSQRLEMDRVAASAAVVFKYFPLSGTPTSDQLKLQATDLYHRFLARDPEAAEITVIQSLSNKGLAADKLALMMCYSIGTSAENILL